MVDQGIHMEVNKVFDHVDISNRVNWYWKDMHSSGACESPLYGMVTELGLRLFGLTLFGVRFFPALIEFGTLILTFFAFRKDLPQYRFGSQKFRMTILSAHAPRFRSSFTLWSNLSDDYTVDHSCSQ